MEEEGCLQMKTISLVSLYQAVSRTFSMGSGAAAAAERKLSFIEVRYFQSAIATGPATEWQLISTDLLTKPNAAQVGSRPPTGVNAAEHPLLDRLKDLATGGAISSEAECAHLTTCNVCRSTLERLSSSNRPKSA